MVPGILMDHVVAMKVIAQDIFSHYAFHITFTGRLPCEVLTDFSNTFLLSSQMYSRTNNKGSKSEMTTQWRNYLSMADVGKFVTSVGIRQLKKKM